MLRLGLTLLLSLAASAAIAQSEDATPAPKKNHQRAGASAPAPVSPQPSRAAAQAPAPQPSPPPSPAQSPPPPPVSADPANTTATFGDWVLRCQQVGGTAQGARFCEVAQILGVQGQTAPIAEVAIGRIDPKAALRLTVALPPNILIPVTPRADIDAQDHEGIVLTWRRCTPGSCFADAELSDEAIHHWRAQSDHGRLQFTNAAGQALILAFSFRGFAQAMDAYGKEGSAGNAVVASPSK
jgi:invasion protein IalB